MIKALVQIVAVSGVLFFVPQFVTGITVAGFVPALEAGVILFIVVRVLGSLF